jgi:hypothetical protein
MCFCETNWIEIHGIFNASIKVITRYGDGAKFFNPVRLESFSAGSE